jgi:hypothetical protein
MYSKDSHNKLLDLHRKIHQEGHVTSNSGKIIKINLVDRVLRGIGPQIRDPGMPNIDFKELKLISDSVKISYEGIALLLMLEGHKKNLLLFLIAYCLRYDGCFTWNRIVAEQYSDVYEIVLGKRIGYNTLRQSVEALKAKNIIQKKNGEEFMLNPLLYHVGTKYKKQELIAGYGGLIRRRRGGGVVDSLFD